MICCLNILGEAEKYALALCEDESLEYMIYMPMAVPEFMV